MVEWREDVLGEGFECLDFDLGEDAEGPLVATLVRSLPQRRSWWDRLRGRERLLEDVDILYVHGWSDYFFQRSLAQFFTERGARFFALDLRKYGRSTREGQTPGYIERLEDYYEEIDLARAEIAQAEGRERRLILLGHSTGGLVLSLWAADHPGEFDALLLNSPWLEFQLSARGRHLLTPLLDLTARIAAHDAGPQLDFGLYSRAQREVGPESDLALVNALWKPERSHPVLAGWLRAIFAGQQRLQLGLGIAAPIGVLLSTRSETPLSWNERLTSADTVLEVGAVARAALQLGTSMTIERIDGALHDVFLSAAEPRAEAYARMERWLIAVRATGAARNIPGATTG